MTNNQVKGLSLAMGTAVISGVANFANGLVVQGMDPVVHSTVKNGVAGLLVLGVLLLTGQWKQVRKLTRDQLVKLGLIAVIGGSVSFVLFFTGVKMIGGATGALIHKTLVLWVALLAIPYLKEKVSGKMALGILLLYGSNFVVDPGAFGPLQLGHGLVLLATMMWAVENIVAKKLLADVSPDVVVGARMGMGSLILMGIMVASGKAPLVLELSSQQWWMLGGVGVLLFGYVMTWYRALKLAPATQVASVLVGASVITTLLNAVFMTHAIKGELVLQMGVIVTGIWLVVMAAMDGWKTNAPLRHARA